MLFSKNSRAYTKIARKCLIYVSANVCVPIFRMYAALVAVTLVLTEMIIAAVFFATFSKTSFQTVNCQNIETRYDQTRYVSRKRCFSGKNDETAS